MFHDEIRRCELVKLTFKRKFDVFAELALRVPLSDDDLAELEVDAQHLGGLLSKGELRRSLGWYDLDINAGGATLRVRDRSLDKPKLESEAVTMADAPELPGVGRGKRYVLYLSFVVSAPLIGDCREQVWGMARTCGEGVDVHFWDRDLGEAGGEQLGLEELGLEERMAERAERNFRENMRRLDASVTVEVGTSGSQRSAAGPDGSAAPDVGVEGTQGSQEAP